MKLSKYLADYIKQKTAVHTTLEEHLQNIIQQGIEAFESTEGVKVLVVDKVIAADWEKWEAEEITDRCQDKGN